MKTFKPGDRVLITKSGKIGTVEWQCINGDLRLHMEGRYPAILAAIDVQLCREKPEQITSVERLRLAAVNEAIADEEIIKMFLDTAVYTAEDVCEIVDFLCWYRLSVIKDLVVILRSQNQRSKESS